MELPQVNYTGKTKFSLLLFFLLIFTPIALFSSCGEDEDSPITNSQSSLEQAIVGTWVSKAITVSTEYTFRANKTFTKTFIDGSKRDTYMNGTWSASGSTIILKTSYSTTHLSIKDGVISEEGTFGTEYYYKM